MSLKICEVIVFIIAGMVLFAAAPFMAAMTMITFMVVTMQTSLVHCKALAVNLA